MLNTNHVCSINDPRLTLTYLKSRSSLLPNAFKWDFFLKDDFLNAVEAKVKMNLIAFLGPSNCINTQYAALSGSM